MAVHRKSGELPQDAVILSEKDAVDYQWKLLMNWTPTEDVWPLKYGLSIIGVSSAISAIYVNNHYRAKLRLHNYGKFASFLPTVVLPAIMSCLFHHRYITNDVIIQKTRCPICIELRAAGIQSFFSTIYPSILAPLAGFTFATRYYTYKVPSIVHNPRDVLALWRKFTHPVGTIFFGICALQSIVAMFITYYEAKSCFTVQGELLKIEQEYDDRHSTQ